MRNVVWSKRTDTGFLQWQKQFKNTAQSFPSELGLSLGELAEIEAATVEYNEAFTAYVNARAAYIGALATKDEARAQVTQLDRKFVARFQAISDLPDDIFCQLDIPERTRRGTRSAALPVSNVVATASAAGLVTIQYSRGENPESALFMIQESRGDGNWANVYSSTRTRVKLSGYTPGETVYFRVITFRNGTQSAPSGFGVIWVGKGQQTKAA